MDDTLARMLAIANLALTFGQVRRVTLHADGEPESDTTHTVMLALMSIEVAVMTGLVPGLAAQFALVHDLPEVYAGDTNTAHGLTVEEAAAKARREDEAMQRLSGVLGDGTKRADPRCLLGLLHRYEAQEEPEARLVRYLDKVLPKLTHYLNGGSALAAMGITADAVRAKHSAQGSSLAAEYPDLHGVRRLFECACELVEDGISAGVVRVADGSTSR